MGKEWLQWVGGSGGGGRRRRLMPGGMEEPASAGCMCAVFRLFDLHHFHFPPNQQNTPTDFQLQPNTSSKGAEAPRNSLELSEPAAMNISSSSSSKSLPIKEDEEKLNFPVGIQIKTRPGKAASSSSPRISTSKSRIIDDFTSESSSNSPGTKTPGLVARLMGLDLLPECSSPSLSSSSPKPQSKPRPQQNRDRNLPHTRSIRSFHDDDFSCGARSLPETPRISSARRSDVAEFHRLSLQINRDSTNDEFAGERRGRRFRGKVQDENVIPGNYAKQIVKQVKESVSRRVGLDITNTISRNREQQSSTRRDENLILLKKNQNQNYPRILSRFEEEISPDRTNSNSKSCSPRLRFLDTNKNRTITTNNPGPKSPRISIPLSCDNYQSQGTIINPLKKESSSSSLKKLPHQACDHSIRNKKEEAFVQSTAANKVNSTEKKKKKKSKRSSPLSSDHILNISSPTLLQAKRDPSPPPTKLPLKQISDAPSSKRSTQLSSKSSHSYKQLQRHPDKILQLPQNVCVTPRHGGASAEYGDYIQRILRRAGIVNKANPLTIAEWFTPSHPIDPSIFHQLELFDPATRPTTSSAAFAAGNTVLSRRCNRKLIFQLVDELLAGILRPHFDLRPWNEQLPLVDELCKRIDGFPAADCLVLEDIDSLIDTDLGKSGLNVFVEEEERIVCEIEDEIVEWLVGEAVAEMGGRAAEEQTGTDRCQVDALTW